MTVLLSLLGCAAVPWNGGQAGEEISDTSIPGSVDSEPDDADTGSAEDGLHLDLGDYEGTVEIDFSQEDEDLGSCSGSASLDVDGDGNLTGSATCLGDIDQELSIGGTVEGGTVASTDGSWDWTGSLEDGAFVGTWQGPDLGGVTHTGRFEFLDD